MPSAKTLSRSPLYFLFLPLSRCRLRGRQRTVNFTSRIKLPTENPWHIFFARYPTVRCDENGFPHLFTAFYFTHDVQFLVLILKQLVYALGL